MADECAALRRAVHPEVTHTKQGTAISPVSRTTCAAAATTGTCTITREAVAAVRAQTHGEDVCLVFPGRGFVGAAALIHCAIGDWLTACSSTTACCV
jgi:hypothetical protein